MVVLSPPCATSCFKIRRFKAVGLDAIVGPVGGGAGRKNIGHARCAVLPHYNLAVNIEEWHGFD
ncbi:MULTISPECIES: hypothetical protein [unclassified Dyella]|uniref:hypothetical protein n=1 Tax=Dyella sp. ASV21 TaxID=2795114 RepID=UPI0018EDDF54|nr:MULTISPECIES: hypothetical protein [unclassified Dyella]